MKLTIVEVTTFGEANRSFLFKIYMKKLSMYLIIKWNFRFYYKQAYMNNTVSYEYYFCIFSEHLDIGYCTVNGLIGSDTPINTRFARRT